jgi:histidyl-tRNA synthetase
MALIDARTMPGVMELLPREQLQFQSMLDTIRRGYERFGFVPIETPAIELTSVLLTKSGGETEKQVYFVQSKGSLDQGRAPELALRFDLTVPLARYVAEHEHQLVFPFRRYQIQRVYRGESAQRGRFREFYQCDIDVIGKDALGLAHDAEIPAIIAGIFQELDIGPFTIRLNNRKLLSGLFEDIGVTDTELQKTVLREVDKLDKRGRDAVVATLTGEGFGLPRAAVDGLMDFVTLTGENEAVLARLAERSSTSERFKKGLEELRTVVEQIGEHGVPKERFAIDLSIARGLDYYTGTVYETRLDEHEALGSVCSGGRYDDLASYYTKSRLPGVGISIGATRLFDQLRAIGRVKAGAEPVDVVVTRFDAKLRKHYLGLAASLREKGLRVEVIQEDWKPKKQLQYVDRIGAPFAVIVGEAEVQKGTVSLKDIKAGQQEEVPQERLLEVLLARRKA